MSSTSFDKVLFVVSTDSLGRYVLPDLEESSLKIVGDLARTEIGRFMNGGGNYFMDADFDDERKSETSRSFLAAVKNLANGSLVASEISSLADNKAAAASGYQLARSKLRSIAARFCYLNTQDLTVFPESHLQEIALKLEVNNLNPLYADFSSTLQAIESAEPASPWDMRVMNAEFFDGIEDVLKLAAKEMIEGGESVRFLRAWKSFLPSQEFHDVVRYIGDEARAELSGSAGKELGIVLEMLKSADD